MGDYSGMNVGNRIRERRKSLRYTMKQLADKVGVSSLTIHRVEMDKVSPSVALLSKIAESLGQPISNFFDDGKLTIVKADTTPIIESGKLKLRLLAPKGLIGDDLSVSLGETQKGEFVSRHAHDGFELTYVIKGKNIFRYGPKEYLLNTGDLIYFAGSVPHSVTASEPVQFISVYFRETRRKGRR